MDETEKSNDPASIRPYLNQDDETRERWLAYDKDIDLVSTQIGAMPAVVDLIGISGKIGSGKTEAARTIRRIYEGAGFRCEEKTLATMLKAGVAAMTGGDPYTHDGKDKYVASWDRTVGQIMQELGTWCRDHFRTDVWVDSLLDNFASASESARDKPVVWVISDVRFPNEADAIKAKGGVLIRLWGDPAGTAKNSTRDHSHISECALDTYAGFDYTIDNDKHDKGLFSVKVAKIIQEMNECGK